MRKTKNHLLLITMIVAILLSACNNEKTADTGKITDIPVTSKSKEAIAAFKDGLAFSDDNNGNKARAAFTKAIQLDSNLAIAYMYRANNSLSTKEAIDDLATAKKHLEGASEWEKMYSDIEDTYTTNDWNKRLEISQKIVAAYPDAARAQVDLGYVYLSSNEVDKAKAAFQKAIDLDPKWIGGYSALSNAYLGSEPKDFKKAEEYALKFVELSPKSSNAEIALGDCYRAQDDLEKAKASYTKAIELNPDEPVAYSKKGHVNSFLGKYDEARSDYAEAAKHDVDASGANLFTALTYMYAGDSKTASQAFMDYAAKTDASGASKSKIAGDKLNYLYNCAMICFHTGDTTHLKETIDMMQAPADQIASDVGSQEEKLLQKANMLDWWALAYAAEGKLDEAKAKAEEEKTTLASVNNPLKLQGYEVAMGYICMKEKKYADAIGHFEKANPNSVYTQYWLAMANEAAGNKDKANAILKQVSVYNFNGVDYAVIRNEVKKKLATP